MPNAGTGPNFRGFKLITKRSSLDAKIGIFQYKISKDSIVIQEISSFQSICVYRVLQNECYSITSKKLAKNALKGLFLVHDI